MCQRLGQHVQETTTQEMGKMLGICKGNILVGLSCSRRSSSLIQIIRHFVAWKPSWDVSAPWVVNWSLSRLQYRYVHHTQTDQFGQWKTVYEGPIAKSVKYVKLLSLTTAATMLVVAPLTIFFGKQAASFPVKVCLVIFLSSMGCGSTGLLHWVSKPYVRRMEFNPQDKRFAVETLTLFSSTKRAEFSVDDITLYRDDRAFSTFEVRGVKYFLHKELVEAQQILHFIEQWQAGDKTSSQLELKTS